jgi:hypothetical protein
MKNLFFIFFLLCANIAIAHNAPSLPFKIRTEKSFNGIFFSISNQNLPFSRVVIEREGERLASNVLIVSNEFSVPTTLPENNVNLPIVPVNMTENLLVLEVFSEL